MFNLTSIKNTLSELLLTIPHPESTEENPYYFCEEVETGFPEIIVLYDGRLYMLHLTGMPTNQQDTEMGVEYIQGDIRCIITTINDGLDSEAVDLRDEMVDAVLDTLKANKYMKELSAKIIFPKANLFQLTNVRLEIGAKAPSAVASVITIIIRKVGG